MSYQGQGVPQDYKTAVKWYTLAAEQGHFGAQHSLGLMYELGLGVMQDSVYAHMWYNIVASQETGLSRLRDKFAATMTSSQIAEVQKLARECVRKKYKGC